MQNEYFCPIQKAQNQPKMSKSVALVLSSGGARGYAHVGVIKGLISRGYKITSIVGCSMGSVVGGMFAAGRLKEFEEWACSLDRTDVFRLYDFNFSTQGLMRGERVFKQLEQIIPDRNIEDLDIPFKAIATDMKLQKEVVFDSGSLYQAMRASSTIPAMLRPIEIGDMELLDGGILNPLPISFVTKMKKQKIIAVDVNAPIPYEAPVKTEVQIVEESKFNLHFDKLKSLWFKKNDSNPPENSRKKPGMFDLITKSIDMMQDRITENILEQHPPKLLVRVSRYSFSTFDYYKAKDLIEEGEKSLEIALSKKKK